uniref:Uncharacterized protein n=1 Tax=Spongospora subterranea TaxID=70186 RepID=A0A0H5R620_9EUKA|eukprot:CRZ03669.1 hypothetical protein [Spongospora subterranea]
MSSWAPDQEGHDPDRQQNFSVFAEQEAARKTFAKMKEKDQKDRSFIRYRFVSMCFLSELSVWGFCCSKSVLKRMGLMDNMFRLAPLLIPGFNGDKVRLPYATLDVVFNHRRLFANIQTYDPKVPSLSHTHRQTQIDTPVLDPLNRPATRSRSSSQMT